jgi:DNA-binding protein H-NS
MRLFGFHNQAEYSSLQEALRKQQQEIAALREQVAQLQQQLAHSQAQAHTLHLKNTQQSQEIARLREEIARLQRAGKRQAAPFSHDQPNPNPKKSGRKPGKGHFTHRDAPSSDEFTEPTVEVPVTEAVCPHCGGELEDAGFEEVSLTDLPPEPRPVVRGYRVHVCRCRKCGKTVRGKHKDVAADQHGATAHRLGQRVVASAEVLHYGMGVPMRKVPSILKELSGVSVTHSALIQAALRQSKSALAPVYKELRTSLKDAKAVNTDDTGWRIGGENAFLMAFESEAACVYQIRKRHRNEEVRELIPSDYAGTLITDRGKSYDAKELAGVAQQKCVCHLLRSCSEVLEHKQGKARWFASTLKSHLREALQLWKEYRAGETHDYEARRQALQELITFHLRDRRLADADNQRLLDEIGRHQDRGNLLRFLWDPEHVEPTNNRAERALRPAVIARKVSHCSENADGAEAFSRFVSVLQTLRKRGIGSLVSGLCNLLGGGALSSPPP